MRLTCVGSVRTTFNIARRKPVEDIGFSAAVLLLEMGAELLVPRQVMVDVTKSTAHPRTAKHFSCVLPKNGSRGGKST